MLIEGDQCKKCGSLQSKVLEHRFKKKTGRVIRRRLCLECGYMWRTVEIYVDDWERVEGDRK